MHSNEIRRRFLSFFENRGHVIIPSAPIIPENDSSVLFTTAGMQPLVPYLLGAPHPMGPRLVDVQKCLRTGDIEEVGDATHHTFFEMLGNWSLGDYFKEEAIRWSYELLTSVEEGFGLDPQRLYVTVFAGDAIVPRDVASFEIWKSVGIPESHIFFLGAEHNWWSLGENGPCGSDSEIFYDKSGAGLPEATEEAFLAATDTQQIVEIWNDVFMEYEKHDGQIIGKLSKRNIDTGAGLERVVAVIQNVQTSYETDLFTGTIARIKECSTLHDTRAERIIADHVRASVFMIAAGIVPGTSDRAYVLRRLIRRAVRYSAILGFGNNSLADVAVAVIATYKDAYPELQAAAAGIGEELRKEEEKFKRTLERGMKEFERAAIDRIPGKVAFDLYQSYGFPVEMTIELAKERSVEVDLDGFREELKRHQELSRAGAEKKFKGGLAGGSEMELRYHTATHLLNAALKHVLGPHVKQRGSNITPERLRFDFSHPEKLSDTAKKEIENFVNDAIQRDLAVARREVPLEEAMKLGAEMEFGAKYPDVVSIYFIEDAEGTAISKEFCGGPHVGRTGELGTFAISKEEAVAAGVRRIKAILS